MWTSNKNRGVQTSREVKHTDLPIMRCTIPKNGWAESRQGEDNVPNNSSEVEPDVEDVTCMRMFKFSDKFPCIGSDALDTFCGVMMVRVPLCKSQTLTTIS
jgi:hypothetical protein